MSEEDKNIDTKSTEVSGTTEQEKPVKPRTPYQSKPQGKYPYRGGGDGKGRGYFRKKVCRFCTQKLTVTYKNPDGLRRFITERGKILPRRITGTCAKHQRIVAREIKKARVLAFLPFVKK